MGCSRNMTYPNNPSEAVPLDTWLNSYVFVKMVDKLKNCSFMKKRAFIIGKANGESVQDSIDDLTCAIRNNLISHLLNYPEINVILKHPVHKIRRPYAIEELTCDSGKDYDMIITIDIKENARNQVHYVRADIRAIDISEGAFIRGFSIYHPKILLNDFQYKQMNSKPMPDEYLRGSQYLPFNNSQHHEMAAFLAHNMSCVFKKKEGTFQKKVFIDNSKIKAPFKNIFNMLEKQLVLCNEIQLVRNSQKADYHFAADIVEVDKNDALFQFWIITTDQSKELFIPGLVSKAYFSNSLHKKRLISGKWKVNSLPDKECVGFMHIRHHQLNCFQGDFFAPDKKTLLKKGIFIYTNNHRVHWAFYDRISRQTFKAKGVIDEKEKKIFFNLKSFPVYRQIFQEFVYIN